MDLPYYHGSLSKGDCESLLLEKPANGNFLLRDSESLPGALCLCVLFNHVVYTYRIFQKQYGHYQIQTAEGAPKLIFPSLKELVSTFMKPNRGLVFHLLNPIKRTRPSLRRQSMKVDLDCDYENYSSEYVQVLP